MFAPRLILPQLHVYMTIMVCNFARVDTSTQTKDVKIVLGYNPFKISCWRRGYLVNCVKSLSKTRIKRLRSGQSFPHSHNLNINRSKICQRIHSIPREYPAYSDPSSILSQSRSCPWTALLYSYCFYLSGLKMDRQIVLGQNIISLSELYRESHHSLAFLSRDWTECNNI